MTEQITRRRLLGLTGASAAGAIAACVCSRPALASTGHRPYMLPEADRQHFVSQPELTPPKITVRQYGPVSPSRYFFLDSPASGPGAAGAVIIDSKGDLVWFDPDKTGERKMDLNVQTLDGKPVLTWFRGRLADGHGEGDGYIADSTYAVQHVVSAQGKNGLGKPLKVDLHEFFITPNHTAIISAYNPRRGVDLSGIGGPSSGHIYSGVFQEIGLIGADAGKLLFQWDSYHHVPLRESHMPMGDFGNGSAAHPFDYFHINSICTDADGNYIVSSRHTWTIYKIHRKTGKIMWRLGGKSSDFTMGPESRFFWQHHVRTHAGGVLTVFDNGAARASLENESRSRALILDFSEKRRHVTLKKAFTYPKADVLAWAMGSAQLLPDGEMFVDWGNSARFSQFTPEGKLLLDGRMNSHAPSYRGFAMEWTGRPATRPHAAATASAGGATVYASWNGSTEVASWVIWAGRTSSSLARAAEAPRSGFETAIKVKNAGPYFIAIARDADKNVLRRSEVVKIG